MVTCHVHMGFVDEADAFRLEEFDLAIGAPERECLGDAAVAFDDSMAGDDAGLRVDVEGIAHNAGQALIADGFGDLAVGGDITNGNLPDYLVNSVENVHSNHLPLPLHPFPVNGDGVI